VIVARLCAIVAQYAIWSFCALRRGEPKHVGDPMAADMVSADRDVPHVASLGHRLVRDPHSEAPER